MRNARAIIAQYNRAVGLTRRRKRRASYRANALIVPFLARADFWRAACASLQARTGRLNSRVVT